MLPCGEVVERTHNCISTLHVAFTPAVLRFRPLFTRSAAQYRCDFLRAVSRRFQRVRRRITPHEPPAHTEGEGRHRSTEEAARHTSAWEGQGSRAAGMAEAADYVVPAIAITAATAVTFIAVSFNELREKSAVQQELKQQAMLLEEQEGVVLRSSLSSKEKRRARQGKKKGS
ncbi:unnamed protein product [Closterium sp. Yama58-4]|nr:unnamed protein product [Closterium sp. Yama58-4]